MSKWHSPSCRGSWCWLFYVWGPGCDGNTWCCWDAAVLSVDLDGVMCTSAWIQIHLSLRAGLSRCAAVTKCVPSPFFKGCKVKHGNVIWLLQGLVGHPVGSEQHVEIPVSAQALSALSHWAFHTDFSKDRYSLSCWKTASIFPLIPGNASLISNDFLSIDWILLS